MIADKVGMDDTFKKRGIQFNFKTKQSKQKGHHATMSDEDHIRHRGLDLLYKESKKGNKKSKDMLVQLLLKKDFPNKYRIANLILKSDEKKRRAVQEELKKNFQEISTTYYLEMKYLIFLLLLASLCNSYAVYSVEDSGEIFPCFDPMEHFMRTIKAETIVGKIIVLPEMN